MSGTITELNATQLFVCGESGPSLLSEADALDLIGETTFTSADWIIIPVARLDPAFFDLSTRHAGLFMQKMVNYQRRVVVLGDVSHFLAKSDSLRDFVRESNRGKHIWFVQDMAELARRLDKGAELF